MEWKQAKNLDNGTMIPNRWVYLQYYEAYNLLFRIENVLRIFVYIVLKNEYKERWVDLSILEDEEKGTLSSIAKKRITRAEHYGYLCYPITCPIMCLNSGELTRLITSETYWKMFKPYFYGAKEIVKNKFEEIETIRNSLAHFRPIRLDDVDVIKQNSKHVLLGIEEFINRVFNQRDMVPTNTQDDWYKELKLLKSDLCMFAFCQSDDEQWIKIGMEYKCPIISKRQFFSSRYYNYNVLTLVSSHILTKFQKIAKDVSYLFETVSYPMMRDNGDARFEKTISFVFSRVTLQNHCLELKQSFEELLSTISQETELMKQDHLARGSLVCSVPVSAHQSQDDEKRRWEWNYQKLSTQVKKDDSPEYWGQFNSFIWGDFISATDHYPWMPESVSKEEEMF